MQLQSTPHTQHISDRALATSVISRMKRARDDDGDDAASGSAMGDDDSRSYNDPDHHGEEDEEQKDQQRQREACDVLLSLSFSCCPSHSSTSCYSRTIHSDEPAPGMAPPQPPLPVKRRRRRRRRLDDVFECQTCGRRFPTFQALGGHRTSHFRRPAMNKKEPRSTKAVLVHACTMCGLGFSTGQALGGHMRRHRLGQADSVGFADVDLTQIIVHRRPTSASSSLQLLNLLV